MKNKKEIAEQKHPPQGKHLIIPTGYSTFWWRTCVRHQTSIANMKENDVKKTPAEPLESEKKTVILLYFSENDQNKKINAKSMNMQSTKKLIKTIVFYFIEKIRLQRRSWNAQAPTPGNQISLKHLYKS